MYSAVVFDLDGTLMDTAPGVLSAVKYTIATMGIRPLERQTILKFIGLPVKHSFIKYCGLTEKEAARATGIFRDRYSNVDLLGANVYDGIFAILNQFKSRNIKIGVATYKREDYAVRLLQQKGIAQYCQAIKGADDLGIKSKRDILLECLYCLEIEEPCQAVLVGDTQHDSEGAAQAQVNFIGVTYGYGFKGVKDVPQNSLTLGAAQCPADILKFL